MLKKLGLGDPKPATIQLLLIDHSVARSNNVIVDVLVHVGSLIFPMDFEPDLKISLILGYPSLKIGGVLLDVAAGRLIMHTHYKVVVFNVYQALKLPPLYEDLEAIKVFDVEAVVS